MDWDSFVSWAAGTLQVLWPLVKSHPFASIFVAFILFLLFLFFVYAARRAISRRRWNALQLWRMGLRQLSRSSSSPYLIVHEMTFEDNVQLWWRRLVERIWRSEPDAAWHPSELAKTSNISAGTRNVLRKLVEPWPHDAIILGGAIDVPYGLFGFGRPRYSAADRQRMGRESIDNKIVRDAVDRVIRIMASAGYMPLIQSHGLGTAEYFFQTSGIEDGNAYVDHSHKLFFRPATVMPHLPFSHTVAGDLADRYDGTVAPDVIAYVIMDANPQRWALGPRLYWLDKLLIELGGNEVNLLREKNFQIIPDQSIDDNKHGAIGDIELFGHGNDETQFMRFDYARVEPASSSRDPSRARRAIWALKRLLDHKIGAFVEETDLLPGDVLLVNNWRVATAWDEECKMLYGTRIHSSRLIHVHHGDRHVFQINFYRQRGRRAPEDRHGGH